MMTEEIFFAMKSRCTILGAMVGDSLGSTLEFQNTDDAKKLLQKYNNFRDGLVGRGPFNLVPGQFTDDTEMGLAIMSVLNRVGEYNIELVAQSYHDWYESGPYDIGKATTASVSKNTSAEMILVGKTTNATSLSNGFMMRLPYLVSFYYNKTSEHLLKAIIQDVSLTHGHADIPVVACIYGLMLRKAIQGFGANKVYEYGQKKSLHSELWAAIYEAVENGKNNFKYKNNMYHFKYIGSEMIGFVGYAIWLLLLCLKYHKSYRDAILEVVGFGGDTDTNACIVGAMMGALYPDTIPNEWIKSVTNFNDSERFKSYPIANPKVWMQWLPK